jgi:hypothetical protein
MTDYPITPPPELVEQWMQDHSTKYDLARHAAQWGADQELEACCEWVEKTIPSWAPNTLNEQLRTARRPKPPSLKEQALALLDKAEDPRWDINDFSIVCKALEQLDD